MQDIFSSDSNDNDNEIYAQIEELRDELSHTKEKLKHKRGKGKKVKKQERKIKELKKKIKKLRVQAVQQPRQSQMESVLSNCLPIVLPRLLDAIFPPRNYPPQPKDHRPMYLPVSREDSDE